MSEPEAAQPAKLPSPSARREQDLQRFHEERMAALLRPQQRSSQEVTVSRNAKADYQYEVNGVAGDGESLSEVAAKVIATVALLDETYPASIAQAHSRNFAPGDAASGRKS